MKYRRDVYGRDARIFVGAAKGRGGIAGGSRLNHP